MHPARRHRLHPPTPPRAEGQDASDATPSVAARWLRCSTRGRARRSSARTRRSKMSCPQSSSALRRPGIGAPARPPPDAPSAPSRRSCWSTAGRASMNALPEGLELRLHPSWDHARFVQHDDPEPCRSGRHGVGQTKPSATPGGAAGSSSAPTGCTARIAPAKSSTRRSPGSSSGPSGIMMCCAGSTTFRRRPSRPTCVSPRPSTCTDRNGGECGVDDQRRLLRQDVGRARADRRAQPHEHAARYESCAGGIEFSRCRL